MAWCAIIWYGMLWVETCAVWVVVNNSQQPSQEVDKVFKLHFGHRLISVRIQHLFTEDPESLPSTHTPDSNTHWGLTKKIILGCLLFLQGKLVSTMWLWDCYLNLLWSTLKPCKRIVLGWGKRQQGDQGVLAKRQPHHYLKKKYIVIWRKNISLSEEKNTLLSEEKIHHYLKMVKLKTNTSPVSINFLLLSERSAIIIILSHHHIQMDHCKTWI